MLRSMTAYAETESPSSLGCFTVEIRSVNKKYRECTLYLPRELQRFEVEAKKRISQAIIRGNLYITVGIQYNEACPQLIKVNIPLVKQLKKVWNDIAEEWGYTEPVDLSVLFQEKNILLNDTSLQNEEEYCQALLDAINDAITVLISRKEEEGAALERDIRERLTALEESIGKIAGQTDDSVDRYRNKLKEHIEIALPNAVDTDERILREIAIYAEKVDISEEITRFKAALAQFVGVLDASDICKGKTLDFISQELQREINTVASKADSFEISRHVVEIKSELERIREQLQNVE